tara:strand:+ start:554 stop:772 length:219 start_codon:yes stop_codon:yes gene_type:complete
MFSFLALRSFLKEWTMKKLYQMFSWEFIIISHIIFAVTMVLLAGCATHFTTQIGDHTIRSGFQLSHEVKQYE